MTPNATPVNDAVTTPESSGEQRPAIEGRTVELDILAAAMTTAHVGVGTLVSILGEPGIGKTRLATRRAAERGLIHAWVRCSRCRDHRSRLAGRHLT